MEIGTQEDNLAFGGPGGFFLAPKPNQIPTKERNTPPISGHILRNRGGRKKNILNSLERGV
jgi:hypothetical protein